MNLFLNVLEQQSDIDAAVAAAAGRAARSIMQGAHVTKSDLTDELHRVENVGAGLIAFEIFIASVAAVGAFAWWSGPSKRRA